MAQIDPKARAVLNFWFEEIDKAQQFKKDPAFDRMIEDRFGEDVRHALAGGFTEWEEIPEGRLALILLLDQFTRNILRGDPQTFDGDPRALALTQRCIAEGDLDRLDDIRHRIFVLMPIMHSEELSVHEKGLPLFEQFTDENTLKYAVAHRDIIADWGRYPHRNAVLGRASTSEEAEFLSKPGSSF